MPRTWLKAISERADIRPPGTHLHATGQSLCSSLSNLQTQLFVEVAPGECRNESTEKSPNPRRAVVASDNAACRVPAPDPDRQSPPLHGLEINSLECSARRDRSHH